MKKVYLDVGKSEDMLQGIIDMVSTEWHCNLSFAMTHDKKYLELKSIMRDMRQKWLGAIVKPEAQNFCITKHLASVCKSKEEVGNRCLKEGKIEEAKEEFEDCALIYGLIITINELQGGEKHVPISTEEKIREQRLQDNNQESREQD